MAQVATSEGPRWQHAETPEAEQRNAKTVKKLEKLIKDEAREQVLAIFRGWSDIDVLNCLVRLKPSRAQQLLHWLPEEMGFRVLAELDPRVRVVMMHALTEPKFQKLILRLDRHEVIRLLDELPDDVADKLVDLRPDAEDLRQALLDEDSAGAVMRQGALVLPVDWTIGQAIEDIRARQDEIEQITGLHVIDSERRLVGYLRIRDLLLYPPETPINDVVRPEPVVVTADTDQEEVLALARRRRVGVIAVVDAENRLVGAITPNDLDRIMQDEAEEDMLLMGGVSPDSTAFDTPLQIVRRRLPWLLIGLVGSSIAALVIGGYEDALTEAAILASFIPVIMATAGNVGIQASTVSIQAITSGATWSGDFAARVGRELAGALMNGTIVGAAMALLVLLISTLTPIDRPQMLALTALLSLAGVTVFAGTFGSTIPFILKAAKQDPAVATGIFITTTNDVVGVILYFAVAALFYL